jgi:hypothetical protein
MLNPFVMKKYAAFVITGMLPVVAFALAFVYGGFWIALGALLVSMFMGTVVANTLIKHPLTMLIEGKGLLVINIDSTGILAPFIFRVDSPYIRGKIFGKPVEDIFDRDAVMQMAQPQEGGHVEIDQEEGIMKLRINQEEFNKAKFAMQQYPVLLYNEQMGTLLTKDAFMKMEQKALGKHSILYLTKITQNLNSNVRDFGRYIVETLKPKGSIMGNWIVWAILGAFILIMIVLFGPSILTAIQGVSSAGGAASSAIQGAGGSVTPLP